MPLSMYRIRQLIIAALCLGVTLGLTATTLAQPAPGNFKPYKRQSSVRNLFAFYIEGDSISIATFREDDTTLFLYHLKDLRFAGGIAYVENERLFDESGFIFKGASISYDSLTDITLMESGDRISIVFASRSGPASRVTRFKQGNRISYEGNVAVPDSEFVRGALFCVKGDISIAGEVNRDVISLFGDITIGASASLRDDAIAITGKILAAKEATVYGILYEGGNRVEYAAHRITDALTWLEDFRYNRVDGAAIYAGMKYRDPDSVLPTVWGMAGYAFESERWRWELGAEQAILRRVPAVIGVTHYRREASDDDWLLGERENTAFALLATEDYKDYYEAEGATAYLNSHPINELKVTVGYRYEETNWLYANQNLWSLFGGSKRFPLNFRSVDSTARQIGIAEIDSSELGAIYLAADYDTRDKDDPFDKTAWHLSLDFEMSKPGLKSSFDYNRYALTARRYQCLTDWSCLILRGRFGNSDGYLPMHKRFFLGGLGSLRGYDQKEFIGTRYWLANIEYRVQLAKPEFVGLAGFWDAGKNANDAKLNGDIEVKQSIGAAVYLGDDLSIRLAERLDRSNDKGPTLIVRLSHTF